MAERCLRDHSPACPVTARIGAVAFTHRFGSSLNEHVHLRFACLGFRCAASNCCVIDGVDFDVAWPNRETTIHDGLSIHFVALADLKASKRATGRPRDIDDLEQLP